MNVEINGNTYECFSYDGRAIDMYLYKDALYDDQPKGTSVRQYVILEDNSIVGVCTSRTWKFVVAIVFGLLCLAAIVYTTSYLVQTVQEKSTKSDVEVVDASTESAVLSIVKDTDYILKYNRYTVLSDGYIDIMYQNIDKDVTLSLQEYGDGDVNVKAGEYMPTLKVNIASDEQFPIDAILLVKIDGDKYRVPIVINDVDSVDYQEVRKANTDENKVDLESTEYEDTDEDYDDPSTYANEKRTIHD